MATVAVFIALGGGAYAAVKLPANSVGSKQIKNNAVTLKKVAKNAVNGSKVKDGSLTALDINLATLPKAPSAANADNAGHATNADNATNATNAANATNAGHATTADTASGLTPHEAVHMVGASGEPGFTNGATNLPDALPVKYHKAGFYKDKEGVVHLQGIVVTGTSPFIFNLPAGYRPAQGTMAALTVFCDNCTRTVSGGGGGTYNDTSGTVLVLGAGIDPSVPDGALLVSGPTGTTVAFDGVSFPAEA
jgi:hypothetical protein